MAPLHVSNAWQLLLVLLVAVLVVGAVVVLVRFERYCLQDLVETPDEQLPYLTRQGWLALIILMIPLGGMFYLYARQLP